MPVVPSEESVLKVRLPPQLKRAIDELFARKRISQVAAVENLLVWLLEQDDLLQSMILGQLKTDDDLLAAVLKRRLKRSSKGRRAA